MEVSTPPDLPPYNEAVSSHLLNDIVSCHQSRLGPVVGNGERGLQQPISGEYLRPATSGVNPHSLAITAVEPRQHETGTEEVPTPPDPVIISTEFRFRHRCSGPVGGVGGRGFRPATSGEYFRIDDHPPISDSSPICSLVTPDGRSVPTEERVQLKRNFLALYYQNVRGLRTKTNTLNLALSSSDYDIIALSETWLRDDICNSELAADYKVYRCDRNHVTSALQRGGGVLIGIKNYLTSSTISLPGCEQLEQVIVRTSVGNDTIYICCIYLRPNSDPDLYTAHSNAINKVLSMAKPSDTVIVLGDYNLPYLCWSLDNDLNSYIPVNASSEQEMVMCESMMSNGLQQINSFSNVNGRILDLAFVNNGDKVDLLEPPANLLKVDAHHKPFSLCIGTYDDPGDDTFTLTDNCNFDFTRCNFDEISASFAAVNWSILLDHDLDDAVTVFYEKIFDILHQLVPLKRTPKKRFVNHSWWTTELRHLRNVLRKKRKHYFRNKSPRNKTLLQQAESAYEVALASTFRNYIDQLQQKFKRDPSSFWNFVKRRRQPDNVPTNVSYLDKTAQCPQDAANLFADFFQGVFGDPDTATPDVYLNTLPAYNIALPEMPLPEHDIRLALSNIDPHKGAGPDHLPPVLVRECADSLANPLAIIYNRSLAEGRFPTVWKTAGVVPVHKSGSVHRVENYRPISILCCVAKVLEKFVFERMYAAAKPIISIFQHGFVKKRSTLSNLMSYTSYLFPAMENRRQVDAVYFDFSKAFDKVPHKIAILKLERLGFPSWLTNWLESYLVDRSAFVKVANHHSNVFPLPTGVPQGSHLGPLIFVLFVNDLCDRIKSHKLLYADDLKIFRSMLTPLDYLVLQNDIDAVHEWCQLNGMQLNVDKCKSICFSRLLTHLHYEYRVNNQSMERVNSIRDLGVIFDQKLKFNEQVSSVTAKAFATLGFLRRNTADFDDPYALKTLYCSLIRSTLEYAVQIWAPQHSTMRDRIERVQKQFLRFALRQLPWRDPIRLPPYTDRCKLLNLPTLQDRRTLLQRLFVFDMLNGNIDCPDVLRKIDFHVPHRRLRNLLLLRIPTHRTSYGQCNPLDMCCSKFNDVCNVYDFNVSKLRFKLSISSL